jgi:CRISPR-associated protein Cas1
MLLVINNYGAYLRKKKDCFLVMLDEKEIEIPIVKVDSIWISTSALISTDAIKSAIENNIDIVLLDQYGDPYGRVWHSKIGSTTRIRRQQLEISNKEKGVDLVKKWCIQKINNQLDLLRKLRKTRKDNDVLDQTISEMEPYREKLNKLTGSIDENRQQILGFEGIASRLYFNALSKVMPEEFEFNGRSRRPAHDPFNCALNYGYGILYGEIERACILAGIDPYIGILHTDDYNKQSFVYDAIEPFRGLIDETVVFLFTTRRFKDSCFDEIYGGYTLNDEGKKILITEVNTKLEATQKMSDRNMQYRNIVQAEMHKIAKEILEG